MERKGNFLRPPYSRLDRRLSCSKQPTPTTRTHTSEAPQSRGLFRFRFVVSRRSRKTSDEQSSWCVLGWCACARTAADESVCECGRRIGCVCQCVRATVTFSFFYTLIAATRRRDRPSSFQRRGYFFLLISNFAEIATEAEEEVLREKHTGKNVSRGKAEVCFRVRQQRQCEPPFSDMTIVQRSARFCCGVE